MKNFEGVVFLTISVLAVSGKYHERADFVDSLTSLPATLKSTFYNMSLNLNPDANGFVGTVNITFDVLDGQTVKNIYLNVDPNYLYVDQVLINDMMRPRPGTPNENNILDINFSLGISGEDNFIYMSFVGTFSSDYGLVRTNYSDDEQELFKIESKFDTGYAPRAFPCMDESGYEASFSLQIKHSSNYTATTNSEVISEDCTTPVTVTKYAVTDKILPDALYILMEPVQSKYSDQFPPRLRQCEDS